MADPRIYVSDIGDPIIRRKFEEVPKVSYFSTSDGPNSSGVTAAQGTLGIDVNPSANTVFWGCESDGTNNWIEFLFERTGQ